MFSNRAVILLLLAVSVTAVALALGATLQSRNSGDSQGKGRPPTDKSHWPIADYQAQDPARTEKDARRAARNKKYDKSIMGVNPRTVSDDTFITHSATEVLPSLPVSQSDVIVVGEIVDARAYLSEDRTGVYSEFSVKVNDLLKDDDAPPLARSDLIALQRAGGRVRFSAGRIRSYSVSKENMPLVGQRYVFFLGRLDRENAFLLLTGYALKDGRAFPLDGQKQFEAYKDADETALLDEIKSAVLKSSQPAHQ